MSSRTRSGNSKSRASRLKTWISMLTLIFSELFESWALKARKSSMAGGSRTESAAVSSRRHGGHRWRNKVPLRIIFLLSFYHPTERVQRSFLSSWIPLKWDQELFRGICWDWSRLFGIVGAAIPHVDSRIGNSFPYSHVCLFVSHSSVPSVVVQSW